MFTVVVRYLTGGTLKLFIIVQQGDVMSCLSDFTLKATVRCDFVCHLGRAAKHVSLDEVNWMGTSAKKQFSLRGCQYKNVQIPKTRLHQSPTENLTWAISAASLSLPPSPMSLSKLAWRTNNSTIRHTITSNLQTAEWVGHQSASTHS